ncbi:hypothetical protein DY218_18000 [Streptomyces triticagri]|uniref:Integral membrane protein n=1 Tax=Streptomyces triticagri TaxID=2293568 RepID=A0A372M3Y1_9ACTN|nr:hypothetical protein [Streptomyces triticagri]RFU85320.1 hypothetical protein DY218_18000 [Streptomyces triticagri]
MTDARAAGVTTAAARRVAHGSTAVYGGLRSLRPSPYLVFGALFWLVAGAAAWRVPVCCEFGQHAAVVERLAADLWSPSHPTVDAPGAGSPYYSPYAVLQAVVARLSGLDGWQVVKLSGPLNLLVLLTGLGRFVKVLTPRPWAPVLALAFLVLLSGPGPGTGAGAPSWSGFLGLLPLTEHLAFPGTFAVGLTFWLWALTGRPAGSGGRPASYAALGALGALVVLVHPVSGVGATVGVVALVAGRQRSRHARVVARWGAAATTAVLLAALWPYFSVFALIGNGTLDGVHEQLYTGLVARYWPAAVVGLPALWLRWRRDRRDPLVLMFALCCLIVLCGWLSGHFTYGRVLATAVVAPQLALAVELAGPRPWAWGRRVLACGAAAAAGACLLLVHAGAVVPRAVDPVGFEQPPRWPSYAWAAERIGPGEVVLTDSHRATRALPGFGPNLVAPTRPDASLPEPERQRRLDAVRRYLDPGSTRAERAGIARRYDVRWVLLAPDQRAPQEAVVAAWGPRTGEVLMRVRGAGSAAPDPANGPSGTGR